MDEWSSELGINSPWMNVAGFAGFLPQNDISLSKPMGAFVTNPISAQPRSPARDRSVKPYAGGFLLHTGYPNAGLKRVLQEYASKWRRLPLPVWVHLLAEEGRELQQMVRTLEGVENVEAVELGLPPGLDDKEQVHLIASARGELPLFVCLPLDNLKPDVLEKLADLGASGLVISAPRGIMMKGRKAIHGRLYGPALHPQLLSALRDLRGYGLPVLAGCGIFSVEQGEAALDCGAAAVQVDGWCWKF
mgnify:FL=1